MCYDILSIGDRQLEPPVMFEIDTNWYGCQCGCDELYRMNQLCQCDECYEYIAIEHKSIHEQECNELN